MDREKAQQGRRLKAARAAAGYRSARAAALSNGWRESSYRAHEGGTRTIGQDDAERYARRFRAAGVKVTAKSILFGDDAAPAPEPAAPGAVPIMGYIGAGAEVEPDYEQVPADGLEQIEVPYPVPSGVIGFQVRGDSMLPKYNDGDVVLVEREQPSALDAMIGFEAALRTADGQRFLKRIMPGPKPHTFNLESINARTIVGARIVWASPVRMIIPNIGLRRIGRGRPHGPRRR
jgi:phage repressor protein C with HTH and peptisase S24 domain